MDIPDEHGPTIAKALQFHIDYLKVQDRDSAPQTAALEAIQRKGPGREESTVPPAKKKRA